MLWIVLILGTLAGAFGGGWRSLRLARQGELQEASQALRRAALVAAICGMVLTVPTLGWPFKEVSSSVPEEISKTVVETVEVPVQVTRWIFFKKTEKESREVTKKVKGTVYHTETRREFSPWLLIPMAGIGCLCFLLEIGAVHLLWRFGATGQTGTTKMAEAEKVPSTVANALNSVAPTAGTDGAK